MLCEGRGKVSSKGSLIKVSSRGSLIKVSAREDRSRVLATRLISQLEATRRYCSCWCSIPLSMDILSYSSCDCCDRSEDMRSQRWLGSCSMEMDGWVDLRCNGAVSGVSNSKGLPLYAVVTS